MIRDGVDQRVSAIQGWQPIQDAPLGRRVLVDRDFPDTFRAIPRRIYGLTRDGRAVYAWYRADGDYVDRWTDRSGTVVFDLTHFRLTASR